MTATAVENFFSVGSDEAALATDFFAGYNGSSANMLFVNGVSGCPEGVVCPGTVPDIVGGSAWISAVLPAYGV